MDCNKTIDFFTELKRLCDSRATCDDVAEKERFCVEDATKLVEIIQKWSDEHPKTYAQDFFEKFPDAPKDKSAKSEYPNACRDLIYGGGCPKIELRIDCCYKCWNEPMGKQ